MDSSIEIDDFYNKNKDFKEYVDKFCTKHRTLPELAFKTVIVQEVYKAYKGAR